MQMSSVNVTVSSLHLGSTGIILMHALESNSEHSLLQDLVVAIGSIDLVVGELDR